MLGKSLLIAFLAALAAPAFGVGLFAVLHMS
jgi:hypothetical protein